jgi:NitT/TauT family transport system permease protein
MYKLFRPFEVIHTRYLIGLGCIFMCTTLFLWQILARGTIISTPLDVIYAFSGLYERGLLIALFQSAITLLISLGLATVISISIAALSTIAFFKPITLWIKTLRFIGFTGLTIVFTYMTDTAHGLKIALLTFGITMSMTTSLLNDVRCITQQELDYARTLKLSAWSVLIELFFLARLPVILTSIRHNAAVGWTILTMVESFTRSEGGIGVLLLQENKYVVLSSIFAIQLTILVYGFMQDLIMGAFITKICPWVRT